MHILTGRRWQGGYPPYALLDGQVRVAVATWIRLGPVRDFHFGGHGVSKVLNYLKAYGVLETFRRVRSRSGERQRNEKFVSFGVGTIVETGPGSGMSPNSGVAFVAPYHPACASEICVPDSVTMPLPEDVRPTSGTGEIRVGETTGSPWALDEVAGWSEHSGLALPAAAVTQLLQEGLAHLRRAETAASLESLVIGPEATAAAPPKVQAGKKPRAAVFGLGHYAKFALLPRIAPVFHTVCCHEIDPAQVGPVDRKPWPVRTSPQLEADESYDVVFVAGYHHTHAPIAAEAMRRGADVVVEKPLATTHANLDDVLEALRSSSRRLFVAFQRRYSRLTPLALQDLTGGRLGEAVSMHATVFEVPLPARHWYRWPRSRGRVVCNGCHWIDYFLHLNGFAKPLRIDAGRLGNGDVTVTMDLANGASLIVALTEHGSPRLNVRDIVRLASGDRTAVIVDQCHYESESGRRRIRRLRTRRADSFGRMYTEIAHRLAAGLPGDTLESVEVSARSVLLAQDCLDRSGRAAVAP